MKKVKPTPTKFSALKPAFNWSNEEWARTFLPQIRVANLAIQRDDQALEKVMAAYIGNGAVNEILESWLDTAEHLEGITELLNCALARSAVVLDRLGYNSAKPPKSSATG